VGGKTSIREGGSRGKEKVTETGGWGGKEIGGVSNYSKKKVTHQKGCLTGFRVARERKTKKKKQWFAKRCCACREGVRKSGKV